MMNNADQLKNCTSASRFMTGGMPEKSPTRLPSMPVPPPRLASVIASADSAP